MSDWPPGWKVGPIRDWPGKLRTTRTRSPFRTPGGSQTPLRATLNTLDRELWHLQSRNVELLVAISAEQFRLDGYPRATAKAAHPGVILSLDSQHGHLSYPCDTYITWESNLRAIALSLESLRKVDRYGVTRHGEQYRGFAAIEAARPMPGGFASTDEALAYLRDLIGIVGAEGLSTSLLVRTALRKAHPDTGGDANTFQRVTTAQQYLTSKGLLT